MPVTMMSSLKGWHEEWAFLQSEDIEYMPLFRVEACRNFQEYELTGVARTKVHDFCRALGVSTTRHSFMDHEILHSFGCK